MWNCKELGSNYGLFKITSQISLSLLWWPIFNIRKFLQSLIFENIIDLVELLQNYYSIFIHSKLVINYYVSLCTVLGLHILVECSNHSNFKNNCTLWSMLWRRNTGHCGQQSGNSCVIDFREIIFKKMDLNIKE